MSIITLSNAAQREIRLLSPGELRALDERYHGGGYHDKIPQFPVDLFSTFRLTPERISTFRCRNGKRSNIALDYDDFINECRANAKPHKNRKEVENEIRSSNFLAEIALATYTPEERKDIAGALWFTSRGITINGITITLVRPSYTNGSNWSMRGEIKKLKSKLTFQNHVMLIFAKLPESVVDAMKANELAPKQLVDLPWSGKERIVDVETMKGTDSDYTQITFARHNPWTGSLLD